MTARCGLSDRVTFQVGDALHLPFEDEAFDAVFLQHVAMNIEDRDALYAEVRRILAPGGRFVTYDLVLRDEDVVYPVPWARDASASFLLSARDTHTTLAGAGYKTVLWRDDTQVALDWFRTVMGAQTQSGPNLGLVMGLDFAIMTGNLARNLRENRLGVLSAVLRARLKLWLAPSREPLEIPEQMLPARGSTCFPALSKRYLKRRLGLSVERRADSPGCWKNREDAKRNGPVGRNFTRPRQVAMPQMAGRQPGSIRPRTLGERGDKSRMRAHRPSGSVGERAPVAEN
jgi:hypothetical protein